MLRVGLLGELTIQLDGAPIAPPHSRRACELLAWLALNPGLHARSELAARLWPDVLDSSARASLRTALHELRRALGEAGASHLLATRIAVGVAADAVSVDAHEFDRFVCEGRLEDALELCRGEPLAGLDEDWVLVLRDEHRERVGAIYERLAAEAGARDDPREALRWSRERVRLEPLSEEAARSYMRHLGAVGDRPAALAYYARLEERLRTQLAVAPSRQTRELAAELRSEAQEAASAPAQRLRLPPALRRRERTGLVGRGAQLERLWAAVGASHHGERCLATVTGEPGIGKTRLLAELCRRAHTSGATVLYGRCREEQVAPYHPFAEALGWYAAEVGAERLRSGPWAAELARLIPALGPEPSAPGAETASARWRLFEAVATLLGDVGGGAPVLVAIDDLHWADRATVLLLAHFVRGPRPKRLALAAAYRENELRRGDPLAGTIADLRRENHLVRVALRGLDRDEVAEIVGAWLGPESPPDLIATLHRETEGNPFFLGEVLRDLSESGAVARREGRWTADPRISDMGIPESVKEAITRRLDRLSEPCGRVLAAASVAGHSFEVDLLERLDWLEGVDVLAMLEEAEAAAIVREEPASAGTFGFRHALIAETVYDDLGLTRRVRLHRAVAEALKAAHGSDAEHLAEIAHHHLQAAAMGDPAVAVDWALRAADAAARSLAHDEAVALLERAMEALAGSDPARECELRLALGEELLRAGREPAARQCFEAAASIARWLSDPARLARAALGRSGLGVSIIAVDESAVRLLREALENPELPDAMRARLLARLAIETYYESAPAKRKRLGDEAVAVARRSSVDTALLDALNARHTALWSPAYLDERFATAQEMLEAAERVGDAERALQARNWLVLDQAELGDLDAMRAEIERHEELAARLRLPSYQWWGPLWRSTLAAIEGRYADAERLIAAVQDIGQRTDDPNARLYVEIQSMGLRFERERWDEIPDDILEREIGRPAEAAYRAGFSWVFAARGDEAAAREQIEWLTARGLRVREDVNRLAGLAELTQALELLGEARPAPAVYEALLPYANRNVLNARAAIGYGAAAHHLGVLAALMERDEAAEAHLRAALDLHEARRAPPWLARTRVVYAELLSRRGDEMGARELASRGLETAERLGLRQLAERAVRFSGT